MEKILLVEDNPAASERIRNFIQKIDPGYEVIVFPMAGEAYSYACGESISLFILDIQLADYKGTNLARQLRALEAYKYTPILFETALAGEELTAYRDVQCYGFLIKPFTETEFREAFKSAIGLSRQLRPAGKKLCLEQKQFILEYDVPSIVYLEAYGKKIVIHTDSPQLGQKQDTISGYSLARLLEMIDDPAFLQCHKSYLVNRSYIEKINKTDRQIVLRNHSETIPVGTKYQSALW